MTGLGRGETMPLHYNGKNVEFARILRKNATPQEQHLWHDFLKGHAVKFYRQRPIDEFIADFYCHEVKLVIEIDGSQHFSDQGEKRDVFRTERLEGYDLQVIRFTNRQIDENFLGCCEFIDLVVEERLAAFGK